MQFLPPTFLSEKAAFLFPNNESGREQHLRLLRIATDRSENLQAPANALEECLPLVFNEDGSGIHRGWEAYVRYLAKHCSGKCVTIDDVLVWNNLRQLQMEDQKGKPAIDPGTFYVPLCGCSDIDPSTTYCHGAALSNLESILATGVVQGGYYTVLASFAVWTATDPAECWGYSPYVHVGLIHFDKEVVEGREHQIAVTSALVPFCGVSLQFENFQDLVDGRDRMVVSRFMSVAPNRRIGTPTPGFRFLKRIRASFPPSCLMQYFRLKVRLMVDSGTLARYRRRSRKVKPLARLRRRLYCCPRRHGCWDHCSGFQCWGHVKGGHPPRRQRSHLGLW